MDPSNILKSSEVFVSPIKLIGGNGITGPSEQIGDSETDPSSWKHKKKIPAHLKEYAWQEIFVGGESVVVLCKLFSLSFT